MLRTRILLGLAPLLILLLATGGYAVALFSKLGGAIDVILRENYRSVVAAQFMKESAQRMDEGLVFTLAGEEQRGEATFNEYLPIFAANLAAEEKNITIPGEGDLADKVKKLHEQYVRRAKDFFALKDAAARRSMYADEMAPAFNQVTATAGSILRLNQDNMVEANRKARELSSNSTKYMLAAMAVGLAVALYLAFQLQRSILTPIKNLTASSRELGDGKLDQVVPVVARDELGQLAESFNKMASKLRAYRQVTTDEIMKARQMTEVTFSALPDAIVALSPDGTADFQNPAAETLFKKVSLKEQLPIQIRKQADDVLKGGADFLPTSFQNAFCLRVDDKEAFLLPRIIGMRGDAGEILGAVVILQDVTRFRLLDEVKTNLVSTVSHELKTPLTSVRMGLHLLLEEQIGALNAKQTELVLAARDDSERLLRMINDLLDLACLESGGAPIARTPESPARLVSQSISAMQDALEPFRVRLVADASPDLPDVAVEGWRMSHVFSNLISNAAKHSPPGEEITIRAARENGSGVRFSVIDKGRGIPEQYQARLFEKFFRVPGAEKGGAGLGLAIAREIVIAHGGNIGVKSQPGKGTEFYFVLPAS